MEQSSDPRYHVANIKRMLNDTISHIRDDEDRVNDPMARALFETTAEVLTGLMTAYDHYERGEPAWR